MNTGAFPARDGVRLAWQQTAGRNGAGPHIVLANGLGGSAPAWKHLIAALEPQYTLTLWDYRGLFSSRAPEGLPTPPTVTAQADDLEDLLAFFHIEKAVFMGWSYGGQVLAELYRRRPDAFEALILLNPMVGPATDSLRLPQLCAPLFTHMLSIWAPFWKLAGPLAERVIRSGHLLSMVKTTGLVGPDLDEEIFQEIAREFVTLDHDVFRATLESAEHYDGRGVLPEIRVPVLLVAGTRDFIVLPETVRETARAIPGAHLVFINRTSHYTAVEKPAETAAAIASFLEGLKANHASENHSHHE